MSERSAEFEEHVAATLDYLDVLGATDAEIAETCVQTGWPGIIAHIVHRAALEGRDITGAVDVVATALERRFGSRPPHLDWPDRAPWEVAGHG
jgi:hypothetical protein